MAITHAQYVSMLQKCADLFKESLFNFGRTSSENIISLVDAIKANATGDYSNEIVTAAASFRQRYASLVGAGEMRKLFDAVFRTLLKDLIDNKGNLDPASNWTAIYDYHRNNGYAVKSRTINYDSSATTSGTGSGTVHRLTINRYGREIEGADVPLNILLTCVSDETSGENPGEEQFSIEALRAAFDILNRGDTVAVDVPPKTIRPINSDGIVVDHSFQTTDIAVADPTDLGAWIDSAGVYGSAKYALVVDSQMSSVEEETNGAGISLEIKGNHTIYQDISISDFNAPHFWSLRVKPGASIAGGTLTFTWGSKSQAVSLTGLSAGAWNIVTATLDENLYPFNWASATNRVQIAISGLSGDTVRVDLVRMAPMTSFNGTWWAMDAGSTQFLAGANKKTFAYGDGLAGSDAVINQLIRFAYGLGHDLPARDPATQVTASGGRTLTFADSGGADTITASSGDFAADGYYVGMIVTIAGTSSNNMTTGPLAAVTATVLTFGADTSLTNEGPISATATLNAVASISDP